MDLHRQKAQGVASNCPESSRLLKTRIAAAVGGKQILDQPPKLAGKSPCSDHAPGQGMSERSVCWLAISWASQGNLLNFPNGWKSTQQNVVRNLRNAIGSLHAFGPLHSQPAYVAAAVPRLSTGGNGSRGRGRQDSLMPGPRCLVIRP